MFIKGWQQNVLYIILNKEALKILSDLPPLTYRI